MNKLKNFLQRKVDVHQFYNENYPLRYKKKHMHYFFLHASIYNFHLFVYHLFYYIHNSAVQVHGGHSSVMIRFF